MGSNFLTTQSKYYAQVANTYASCMSGARRGGCTVRRNSDGSLKTDDILLIHKDTGASDMSYNSPQKVSRYPKGMGRGGGAGTLGGSGLDSDDEIGNGGGGGNPNAFGALGSSNGNLDRMMDDSRYDAVYDEQMLSHSARNNGFENADVTLYDEKPTRLGFYACGENCQLSIYYNKNQPANCLNGGVAANTITLDSGFSSNLTNASGA